ncbi:hypothetical protein KSC_016180 [Ktedonobacter sp. SOSP1-52]|nr:hypothetical protein KSC_016180 [Ktedonobacter sp. SOSP1-52]
MPTLIQDLGNTQPAMVVSWRSQSAEKKLLKPLMAPACSFLHLSWSYIREAVIVSIFLSLPSVSVLYFHDTGGADTPAFQPGEEAPPSQGLRKE